MRYLIVLCAAFIISLPAIGYADYDDEDSDSESSECQGNCPSNGGSQDQSQDQSQAAYGGDGGNAKVKNSGNSRNYNSNRSNSSSTGIGIGGGASSVSEGSSANTNSSNTVTITEEGDDVRGAAIEAGKALVRYGETHAETAPRATGWTVGRTTPCGDVTGLSGQTGIVGGGLSTITETCRAFRLQQLEVNAPAAWSTRLAKVTHFIGWLPRTVLHVASFGVLN